MNHTVYLLISHMLDSFIYRLANHVFHSCPPSPITYQTITFLWFLTSSYNKEVSMISYLQLSSFHKCAQFNLRTHKSKWVSRYSFLLCCLALPLSSFWSSFSSSINHIEIRQRTGLRLQQFENNYSTCYIISWYLLYIFF